MKNYKKIGLGFVSLLLLLAGTLAVSPKANAANLPQNFQSDPSALFNTHFTYKSGRITATIVDVTAVNQPSYDLTFVQNSANKLEYDTTQLLFCQSNVQIVAAPAKLTLSKPPAGSSFQGNLDVYARVQGGSACKHYQATKTIDNQDTGSGGSTGPPATLTYNSNTYSQIAGTELYGLSQTKGSNCYGGSVILANATFTSGTAFLGLEGNGGSVPLQPSLVNAGASSRVLTLATGCGFQDPKAKTDGYSGTITNGKLNAPTPSSGGGGGTVATDNSCEANYTGAAHEFNWLFCGILRGMDAMFNTIHGQVEGQLNICTGTSSTTGDPCGNNLLTPQVEKSWAVFRDLATALLIVAMLIMVFSQALSFGPFDAYTVRKMLPKLAAAAIIMQISWPLFKFFVDLSNDLGAGIQDLMLAPFGGPSALSFDNLIGSAGNLAPGLAVGSLFTALVVGSILSGFTIMGVMFLGMAAILSVITGLLVLLLRQMLIIMAMILAPIALLAWILPGTQRYFKLWQDNFTKLLFMFPLIMAMIAAGKIFAKIGVDTGTGFFGVIIVFVGFLAPLWMLPKTFKWGGQVFAAAANGTWGATKGMRNYPGKYAIDKAKENRQQRAVLRATRLADDPNNRRFRDRLFAGEFNYTRERGRGGRLGNREMQFAKTLAEGEKATRESVPAQLLRTGYDSWRHGPATDERGNRIREGQAGYVPNKLDANQAWLEGRTYEGVVPDAALSGHAFDTLTTLGDPDRLREARESENVSEEVWSKAVARNFPKLNEIARYLTLAPDLSGLSPRQFTTQDDDTVEELERQLRDGYIHDRETGGRIQLTAPQRVAQLQRAANLAAEAQNPLIWSDLGQTKRTVIRNILAMPDLPPPQSPGQAAEPPPPAGPPPENPPPPPPAGPGVEEDEGEIDVDN